MVWLCQMHLRPTQYIPVTVAIRNGVEKDDSPGSQYKHDRITTDEYHALSKCM